MISWLFLKFFRIAHIYQGAAMEIIFKDYLFSKHILVNDKGTDENAFETLFSIANLFNIRIKEGQGIAHREMIEFISRLVGEKVPEPFYKGFPESVKKLSSDKLLFEQMVHYSVTYGFGNFSEAGHSLMEENFERIAFKEKAEIKDFVILNETDAENKLTGFVDDMFCGTRPLSEPQFKVISSFLREYSHRPSKCASKNLAIRLLVENRALYFARFLQLPDITKVVEDLNYRLYDNTDVKKLNLKNQDRKLIISVIDYMFGKGLSKDIDRDIISCFERKAVWSGLLHHLHYKPKNAKASEFVRLMRGNENNSVYSGFESEMSEGNIAEAVEVLKKGKGSGSILRNLDYLISRCGNEEDEKAVLDSISSSNVIILLQLLIKYSSKYRGKESRTFKFTRFERLKVYSETEEDVIRRKSFLTEEQTKRLRDFIHRKLKEVLKNRLGKVYIESKMRNMALPLQETASSGGLGVLAKGSRIPIPDFKKIRAFTYWEKVNDIDLSAFGLTESGTRIEFSWRTMADNQSEAITYSGDQTSGFKGGSEYFDINLEEFKKWYPQIRYIIFCDNVFSPLRFSDCFCKAGYMIRDNEDSGKVFEPKTVASSFLINSDSTFAYLFGIDLEMNSLIWLNMNKDSHEAVAGESSMTFLLEYFSVTDIVNVKSFFEMAASEIVDDPKQADVVVSDSVSESEIKEGASLIHSYDFEKMTAIMG